MASALLSFRTRGGSTSGPILAVLAARPPGRAGWRQSGALAGMRPVLNGVTCRQVAATSPTAVLGECSVDPA